MICTKKSKNVEYCQFKMIKLIDLDHKSGIKMKNYSDFLFLMIYIEKKTCKMALKLPKMSQNDQYSTLFNIN